jgi:hypothetical protein
MAFHHFRSGSGHAIGGESLDPALFERMRNPDGSDDPIRPGRMETSISRWRPGYMFRRYSPPTS